MSRINPSKIKSKIDLTQHRARLSEVVSLVRRNPRRSALYSVAGFAVFMLIIQIVYPSGQMPFYSQVDGVNVSGWKKQDAAKELDRMYADKKLDINFGERDKAQMTPKFKEFGLKASNSNRVDTINYSWWLRLVPTSLFWGQTLIDEGEPSFIRDEAVLDAYIQNNIGDNCQVEPKNATLTYADNELQVVPATMGGKCELDDVKSALANFTPQLEGKNKVSVAVEDIEPVVNDDAAQQLGEQLTQRIGEGVAIMVNAETVQIPRDQVMQWLDFVVEEASLRPVMNADRASEFLNSTITPKVSKPAGVSKITTKDFVVVSQEEGATGQTLNYSATLASVLAYLNEQSDTATAVTAPVPPKVEYTRSYSSTDAGLSALIEHYANDNPGVYGVSIVELSGQRRRAGVNENRQFTTASTYKLFVAYSTLKRVENGTFGWSDAISGGRNLEICFDDMIVKSDNACAEALLEKIGFRAITDEMKQLGLADTTFLKGDSPLTTSHDLSVFLATLESGQMLNATSRARLIDAMKRNIYRNGIPAGTSGQVADKVGFLDNLLHDAAIVYSPNGTYILTILTEDSSWGAIADLTREIEKLRS